MRRGRYLLAVAAAAAVSAGGAFPAVSLSPTISVLEKEWGVTAMPSSVKAGVVIFYVKNTGHLAHEFILLQTSTPAAKLKVKGSVAVLSGKVVGKTSQFGPGKKTSLTVSFLKPGHYVLLCNLPAHYAAGQRTDFTVH